MSSMSAYESRTSVTAGGRTRQLTEHSIVKMRERHITEDQVAYALDNWVLRGIENKLDREPAYVHFAYISELGRLMKVVISMDDARIVTVHPDRNATKAWRTGQREYFTMKYQDLEESNESRV